MMLWRCVPHRCVPEQHFLDNAFLGRCIPWTMCPWPMCPNSDPCTSMDHHNSYYAGLMCPRPMCPRPKILGCCAPGTKGPLDIVSLTNVSRPWSASSMQLAPSAGIVASVGLRRLMDQWGVWPASPTPLTRIIGLAPLRRMQARPTHRIKSKGWDGSVRGKIAKGHFVQGMQHRRIFGRGHIGRGWTNIAPSQNITVRQLSPGEDGCYATHNHPREAASKHFRAGTQRSETN